MRVFIAIDIEGEKLRDNIHFFGSKLIESRARLKLVEKINLHLTLKFIGEVDEKDVDLISNAVMEGVKGFKKFEIEIRGAGAFPSLSHPRVIWVGVRRGADTLSRLATSISNHLDKAGFRGDPKPFKPHITIARVKRYGTYLGHLIKEYSDHLFGEMLVRDVRVKRSKLTPQGPIYSTLKSIELE